MKLETFSALVSVFKINLSRGLFCRLSSAAPLRHNPTHTYCLWPPHCPSPRCAVSSLDQTLKSGVWCRDRHVNEAGRQCWAPRCQHYLHVVFYTMSSDTTGLLTRGHRSAFSTLLHELCASKQLRLRLLCSRIYRLPCGRRSRDVSTFCRFLLKAQHR